MSGNQEANEKCSYDTSKHFDRFDYPFHKVDLVLFKKAIEDLVLPDNKNNFSGEN